MNIKLSYVGYLDLGGVKSGSVVEVDDDCTIATFLTDHGVKQEHQRHIKAFINNTEQRHTQALNENDELTLVLQIGGGAPEFRA